MAEHPNATVFRKVMEGIMSGDESAMDLISDHIVYWEIGSPEPKRGKQALMESMADYEGLEYDIDIHDITASDDHVVGLVTATVRDGDREFTYRTAEIAHVEDGKITERWAFSDDTQAIIDYFSSIG